jgi:hypothetical protein
MYMAERFSYLALENDFKLLTAWFAEVPHEVTVNERPDRLVYYYRGLAKQALTADIDQSKTPLVFVMKPQKRRRTLWTDGEVLFTPTPFRRQFPALHRTCQGFAEWLRSFDLVFGQQRGSPCAWNYYLEGGIQESDAELFALPQAMEALRQGQYFVHHRDNQSRLETVSRALRLRDYDVD